MAIPTVSFVFSNSSVADASEVNTNFNDILSAFSSGTADISFNTLTLTSTLTANGNVTLGNAAGDTLTVNATPTFVAATTFSSTLTANGNVTLGDNSSDTLTVNATPTFNAAVTVGAVDFTVDTDTLYVDAANDRVGIGTTSPTTTFEVKTPSAASQDVVSAIDTSDNIRAALRILSGNRGALRAYDGTGTVTVQLDSAGDSWLTGGSVGIGTTSPGGVGLDVQYTTGAAAYIWRGAGSTNAAVYIAHGSSNSGQDFIQFQYGVATGRGSGTNSGGIERSGATTTPAFFTGSDRRIKENIFDMPKTLNKLCQIQLKEFDYKEIDAHACGPIAQDLYLIFPDKVKAFGDGLGETVPEDERAWTVNRDWDWEIIKAIQELKAENDALKARVDALESA